MAPLSNELRSMLERAIIKAREASSEAALAALTTLAVMRDEPFASLDREQRRLRNALRAKARQLGDGSLTKGFQPLIEEVAYENVAWRGLRCTITVTGTTSGMKVDIRTKAGDLNTSLTKPKPPNPDGTVSILVEDDDRMGEAALIVILDSDGIPMKQVPTTIGG